jgi:hypothetical protein
VWPGNVSGHRMQQLEVCVVTVAVCKAGLLGNSKAAVCICKDARETRRNRNMVLVHV